MSRRLLILPVLAAGLASALVLVVPGAAWASNTGGQNGTTGSTSASTGDGTVTVGVGIHRHRRPSPGSPTPTTPPAPGSPGASGFSTPTSDPPAGSSQAPAAPTYTCTTGPVNLVAFQHLLGVGGPEPGYWAVTICTGPGAPPPSPAFWVTIAHPGTPGAPGTDGTPAPPPSPVAVALQAEKQLQLPATTIEMAPPAATAQLVNAPSWLWLGPATWKPYTATASIEGVSASATATPVKVVWDTGDGGSVTCDGPGTPYDATTPDATTDCSYTWTTPSASQPGGSYTVTATTYWSVTWTAVGAPGGGNLGLVAGPAATTAVQVDESEALNSAGPGGS